MTDQETQAGETGEVVEVPTSRDELEQAKVRVAELESQLAAKENGIVLREQRISELESAVSGLRQDLVESNGSLAKLQESLNQAVSSYRTLVAQSNPGVLEELVRGDSIEAINSSLKSAQELVGRVKQSIASEMVATRVPAGAPPRAAPDVSALSPREKIHYGLGK